MSGGLDWDGGLGVDTPRQLQVMIDAGLYDPDAPEAANRLQLLRDLVADGCTLEEMLHAEARGRLFALAGDRILRPGRDTYTLHEVAAQLGTDVDFIARVWRALGLPDLGLDTPVASPHDVSVLPVVVAMQGIWGRETVIRMCRAYGAALDRLSHAEVDATRPVADNVSLELGGGEHMTSQSWKAAVAGVIEIGRLLDVAHRYHLETAMRRTEQAMSNDLASRRSLRQAIGFVDLCGFTALSGTVDTETLSTWLTFLEERAYEIVAEKDGRVVKFIGDEVMIVASTPTILADILTTIVESSSKGEFVRVGAAFGEVLAQDGDYFGSAVNLASRLVDVAEPGTLWVSPEFADGLDDDLFDAALQEPVKLRGFQQAITPYQLKLR